MQAFGGDSDALDQRAHDVLFGLRGQLIPYASRVSEEQQLMPIEHLQLPVFDWWDKAQHALAFVVLTCWALLLWPVHALRVLLGMLAYGAGIEAAQWAIGWRFAEWADLAADAVGVSVGWMVVSGWWRFQSLKQEGAVS